MKKLLQFPTEPATVLAAFGSRSSCHKGQPFASRDSSSCHAFGQSIGCRYCHAWGHMLKDYAKKKQADLRRNRPDRGSSSIIFQQKRPGNPSI
ncbi:conserved hypothetical protein [Ricinus communis]|uniref:Uncharacterized protein n=1 Tax=Ricinus communis TaxID=3988 RepID=B9T0G9_RICCO|nr:conserved hypothetical protein [Ricinus communis]